MSDIESNDRENLVRQKMKELRQTISASSPGQPTILDVGESDPITQEAAFRLAEEDLDKILSQYPSHTIPPQEIERIKHEFRDRIAREWSQHRQGH